MQVVLLADVEKVGKRGDLVDVANGHGRNYLVPRGMAILATKGITTQAQAMRRARDLRDAKDREVAESLARNLVSLVVRIDARAGAEGKLFGSVTIQEIVDRLRDQTGIEISRRQVELHEHIKMIGNHAVPVKLHNDVHIQLNVEIVPAESE